MTAKNTQQELIEGNALDAVVRDIEHAQKAAIYANAGGLLALLGLAGENGQLLLCTMWSFGLGLALGGLYLFFSPALSLVRRNLGEDLRSVEKKLDAIKRLEASEENRAEIPTACVRSQRYCRLLV